LVAFFLAGAFFTSALGAEAAAAGAAAEAAGAVGFAGAAVCANAAEEIANNAANVSAVVFMECPFEMYQIIYQPFPAD